MRTYVYGCPSHKEERIEKTHEINDEPKILCPVCSDQMRRVPQPFRYYNNPADVLFDLIDKRYGEERATRRKARMIRNAY